VRFSSIKDTTSWGRENFASPIFIGLLFRRVCLISFIALCLAAKFFIALALQRVRPNSTSRQRILAEQIRHAAILAGGAWIKIAQILATRHDLLEPDAIAILSELQDRIPPIPFEQVRKILNGFMQSGGRDIQRIDEVPLATGSIAQIYRATSRTRGQIVIKVRKPGIEQQITLDLTIARTISLLISKIPAFKDLPIIETMDDVCRAVRLQTDFNLEAFNTNRFRSLLFESGQIRFAKIYRELSSPDVIVMDYESGLLRLDDIRVSTAAHREIVENALRAIYEMIFFHGLIHCDVHPGNLCYRESGEIFFLDCGLVTAVSATDREDFLDFFLCIALSKGRQAAEIVLRKAICLPDQLDRAGFERETADLISSVSGLSAGEFSVAAFLVSMFAIQRRFGVVGTPAFTWMALVLLIFEGFVRGKYPEMDFQDIAFNVIIQRRAGIEVADAATR
jgi:ubiquinone biosynthesis protein